MKRHLLMDCTAVKDYLYESEEETYQSFFTDIRIALHLLFCPECTLEQRNLEHVKNIMETDFFPPAPDFEEPIMEHLQTMDEFEEEIDAPTGVSFRNWVIIGFFLLFSLASAFFGLNFTQIAASEGSSFLLPVGITIGTALTCYGAFFIASHLKELSARFRLR